jgi:hypothetical protein
MPKRWGCRGFLLSWLAGGSACTLRNIATIAYLQRKISIAMVWARATGTTDRRFGDRPIFAKVHPHVVHSGKYRLHYSNSGRHSCSLGILECSALLISGDCFRTRRRRRARQNHAKISRYPQLPLDRPMPPGVDKCDDSMDQKKRHCYI